MDTENTTLEIPFFHYADNFSFFNDTDLNSTTLTPCPEYIHEVNLMHAVTLVLYGLVCILGLCGNTLVIYVVLRYSKMQTVTNLYILNLAVADELFLFGVPLLLVTIIVGYWPFGNAMCKVYMTTTSINQFSSSIFLTVMSTDRYIAVCHPISSPKYRTPFISKVVCLTGWAASALMMVPIFMYASQMNENCQLTCNILWPESGEMNGQTAFTLYSFILGFAIPLVLIFVFYSLVIRKLKRVGPRNKSKEKKKSHRKVTKLVLTVITVYVACWLPYWIGQVTLIFTPPKQNQEMLSIVFFLLIGCLSYSNSAVNPILYAFLSENFKKSFLKACQCAARLEVNAQLQIENSVFPRRNRGGSEKSRLRSERESDEEGNDHEPSTAITMTSRSTTNQSSASNEKEPMLCKNGIHKTQNLQPLNNKNNNKKQPTQV